MPEIKCPKCGEVFKVDESGYADIVNQVRGAEFEKEVSKRIAEEKTRAVERAEAEKDKFYQKQLSNMEGEIARLQAIAENAEKEKTSELNEVRAKALAKLNSDKEEYGKQLSQKDIEIAQLKADAEKSKAETELAVNRAVSEKAEQLSIKETEIARLKEELKSKDDQRQLAVLEEVTKVEKQFSEKKAEYELEIKKLDEEVQFYKDFKLQMSTKMVGETLEKHCENQFNNIRMMAFPHAEFSKDNDASSGSKGDYIFREFDENGIEIISIMFEMKNEADATATKHKNKDFFKKLDKDRKEKNCEYAVLVSMLEADSDYYNTGIVDVSYEFPKMYVIRPTFFIQIISLLRNAAMNSLSYKREIEAYRQENIDITHFEENMEAFKNNISLNYQRAGKKFDDAIAQIDKSIENLKKVREDLLASENNLRIASTKAEEMTIKRLTRNSPTLAARFEALGSSDASASDSE